MSRDNGLGYVGSIFLSVAGLVGLSCLCVDGANKFVIHVAVHKRCGP